MPHYRDGTEAQTGDHVRFKTWDGSTVVGILTSVTPGGTSCNGTVAYVVMAPVATQATMTLGDADLVHRDDA